jgi:hypothetical protein
MESGVPGQQDSIDEKLDKALIEGLDAEHARICAGQRRIFRLIARVDRLELWRGSGARDMAHWLWMRYGVSEWKARRWIASSHALEGLPRDRGGLRLR